MFRGRAKPRFGALRSEADKDNVRPVAVDVHRTGPGVPCQNQGMYVEIARRTLAPNSYYRALSLNFANRSTMWRNDMGTLCTVGCKRAHLVRPRPFKIFYHALLSKTNKYNFSQFCEHELRAYPKLGRAEVCFPCSSDLWYPLTLAGDLSLLFVT